MNHPFEDEGALYHVLLNEEEQYSLWPGSVPVPAGWRIVLKEQSRSVCLQYIEVNWNDMRPNSLRSFSGKSEGR